MKKCKLCNKNPVTSKHHIVPRSVIDKINPKSPLSKLKISLCDECHKTIHHSFLLHLIMSKKVDGYNKYDAVKYRILSEYMKSQHNNIYHEWQVWMKEFIENAFKEFEGEESVSEEEEVTQYTKGIEVE